MLSISGFRIQGCPLLSLEQYTALAKCNDLLTPANNHKRRITSYAQPNGQIHTRRGRTLTHQFLFYETTGTP